MICSKFQSSLGVLFILAVFGCHQPCAPPPEQRLRVAAIPLGELSNTISIAYSENFMNHSGVRKAASKGFQWDGTLNQVKRPLINLEEVLDVDSLISIASAIEHRAVIAISFASREYLRVTLNWVQAQRRIGFNNFLIIAGDHETAQVLEQSDVACVRARVESNKVSNRFKNSAGFSVKGLGMIALKYPVVRTLLKTGLDVIMSDADAVWLRSPLPYFLDTDIAFQRVAKFPAAIAAIWGFSACSGFVFFRHCDATIAFASECVREHTLVCDDQVAFNLALLAANVQWDLPSSVNLNATRFPKYAKVAPPRFLPSRHKALLTRPRALKQIQSQFEQLARLPIRGVAQKHGLKITSVAHHHFWRHPWIQRKKTEMIICHPNSPKDDNEKMKIFKKLGIDYSLDE